jgi:hypothetical protein
MPELDLKPFQLEARGRNGWFKPVGATVWIHNNGEVAFGIFSKQPFSNCAPVYFRGNRQQVLAFLAVITEAIKKTE